MAGHEGGGEILQAELRQEERHHPAVPFLQVTVHLTYNLKTLSIPRWSNAGLVPDEVEIGVRDDTSHPGVP